MGPLKAQTGVLAIGFAAVFGVRLNPNSEIETTDFEDDTDGKTPRHFWPGRNLPTRVLRKPFLIRAIREIRG